MNALNNVRLSSAETLKYLGETIAMHYDLGELVSLERNERGYINISYDIETVRDAKKWRHHLRHYRRGADENNIRFEHALMRELLTRGFNISPSIVRTRDHTTYAKVAGQAAYGRQKSFLAVFNYLSGEDKYSWDAPSCTIEELKNAAEVLALYHNTIFGWKGVKDWQAPRIIDQIPMMEMRWRGYAQIGGNTVFEGYFKEVCNYLFGVLDNPQYITARSVHDELPHLAIHGDYHPGNLKFQDGEVVGLFDFDWAKVDARCFDVGIALTYFCTAWEQGADGNLLLDRAEIFLQSYQAAAEAMQALGPLNRLEIQCLPQMILASNLYVLDWTIGEFYTARPDAEEYLRYLQHGINSLRWLESNWGSFVKLIMRGSQ